MTKLGQLVKAYNTLGALMRRERLDLYQRELLLDTVIQTTPLVMVLTNSGGRIVYSNIAARNCFTADTSSRPGFPCPPRGLTAALAHGADRQ